MLTFRYKNLPFFYNADVEGTGGTEATEDTTTQADKATDAATDDKSTDDSVKKMIEKAVADAVAGLRKKNEEVIGTNKRLKTELDALKAKPTLSDDEFAQFQNIKERIERDELLKLLTEGKSEEVVERVSKRTRLEMEAKVAAEAEARAKAAEDAIQWRTRYETTMVEAEITKSAAGLVKPQYTDLVNKLVTDRVKHVEGAVRVIDPETGEIATNMTVPELIESLRGSYPDLFVTSAGGGAGGSQPRRATTGGKLPIDSIDGSLSMADYAKLRNEGRI